MAETATDTQTLEPAANTELSEFDAETFDADRAKRTILAQRESERKLKAQLAELQPKAEELDKIKAAQKTELERLTEQLEAERTQRTALERQVLRSRVALQKALPADLAERLQGETEEELIADADKLLALVTPVAPGAPRASSRQGAPEPQTLDEDPLLRSLKSKLGIQ
jgi:chromosome segregation ATPase